MRRIATICCVAIAAIICHDQTHAQYGGSISARNVASGVVSPTAANRLGLKRAWFTQIEMDRSQARVAFLRQHISTERFATKFEVTWPDGREVYTEETVDRFGDPLGLEGAEQAAKDRVAELKEQDVQAKLETKMVPEITVYAQTDRGALHAIDGATGRTKWVAAVGNRNHPTLSPGANDKFVAVVNGSNLFVLDQATGKHVWTRQLDSAPGAGPAVTEDHVFVPSVGGKLEVYELENHRKPPWFYQSTGRLLVQPTDATNSVSWATDRGYLYVGHKEKRGVRFRLETRDAITSHATYLPPNRLFAASIDGYAYCVHEFNGDILWRFSAGDPISESPVVTPEACYLIADGAGLYCVNPDDGLERWWSPRITKILSVSETRLYCMAPGNRFVVLDAKTGGRIDSVILRNIDLLHANWQTDRIFVGTTTGVVQCLHEMDAQWPIVHNAQDPEDSAKPEVIQRRDGDEPPADGRPEPVDPFDGGADPFAGGADPFGGDGDAGGADEPADPFGGGADPFGGGDAGGDPPADPFGGDAPEDPFG